MERLWRVGNSVFHYKEKTNVLYLLMRKGTVGFPELLVVEIKAFANIFRTGEFVEGIFIMRRRPMTNKNREILGSIIFFLLEWNDTIGEIDEDDDEGG